MTTTPGARSPRPEALSPGTRVGRWRVVEPLGVGGQGAVYRVEDVERPGVFRALKLALHAPDARAEREVELMRGRGVHPHVVGFHDCFRWPDPHGDRLGVVMEWVPGLALDVWAESSGTTFRQLAGVAATVARTLGELHTRGVLHRDLKPEHLRIRASDGQPVLLDFGAAWFEGAAPLTTGPLPPATLYLLSPEAVRFLWTHPAHSHARYPFRPSDDLYALGVCLYRATTGHYPFSEWLPADVLQSAIVHVRPQAPQRVNPRVPRALSDVIVRLLEKAPSARPPSGAALHTALVAAARDPAPAWDAPIFTWEVLPPDRPGALPERHLLRPPRPRLSVSSEPPAPAHGARRRRGPGWLVRVAAVLLLVLIPSTRLAPLPPEDPVPWSDWATDVRVESVPAEPPPAPRRNQKRAPCTARLEFEVSGVCWLSLEHRPPDCPPPTVAYNGKCLLPVQAQPLPTSVDGGAPDAGAGGG